MYPDTGEWDPERNISQFLAAMPEWIKHGLNGITVGLQGEIQQAPLESIARNNSRKWA